MNLPRTERNRRLVPTVAGLALFGFLIAGFTLLFHDLRNQRQFDTQMLTFGLQMLQSARDGHLLEYIFAPHKYPFFLFATMALPVGFFLDSLLFFGNIKSVTGLTAYLYGHPVGFNLLSRSLVFLTAVLTVWLVYLSVRKLYPKISPWSGILMVASSTMFLTFSSAVRPHAPAAFMAILTFYSALCLYEKKNIWREFLAFLCAAIAFATLQDGIFALIFTLTAFLTEDGIFKWKMIFKTRLWIWLGLYLLFVISFGYPFLWKTVFSGQTFGRGLGNTDFDTQPFNGNGFFCMSYFIRGSEILLLYFFLKQLSRFAFRRDKLNPLQVSGLIYFTIYIVFFGLISGTGPRMYLPLLPLMAVLSAPAFYFSSTPELIVALLLTLFVHLRFATLALRPDSWQVLHDFLAEKTTGTIATDIPRYFLDIPPTRKSILDSNVPREQWLVSQKEDLKDARDFAKAADYLKASVYVGYLHGEHPSFGTDWTECQRIESGPTTEMMFLWVEMDDGLELLKDGKRMGPNFIVYCRRNQRK